LISKYENIYREDAKNAKEILSFLNKSNKSFVFGVLAVPSFLG